MKEGTKKLSDDELERVKLLKVNTLLGIFVTDERTRWYLAGLIDGYQIHHNRQVTK